MPDIQRPSRATTVLLTALAMLAFAANSLLCRLALKHTSIDAASFTLVRIASGALVLWALFALRRAAGPMRGSWLGAVALFVYALAFSLAYVRLETGTGALLLFGAVQLSMLAYGFAKGERLRLMAATGLMLAMAGLVALLLPGASAPPVGSALLMLLAGVAWGVYSLLGRGAADPLAQTAGNFLRALPLALLAMVPVLMHARWDAAGTLYAVLSGAVTSGLGYAVWYSALRGLTSLQAASVQLSVPILAALGGVVFVGEAMSMRLAMTSVAVLGGVALVLGARQRRQSARTSK